MSSALYEAEYLRGEALRFVSGVHRNPAIAVDQEVLPWYGFTGDDDYTQLLEAVELRFLNRPDGAGNTHARLMELVRSYFNSLHRPRSRLHADVCILLIGHADLFNRFENLRFMNDGGEETRRQMREWRDNVRNEITAAISAVLADCLSAIAIVINIRIPQMIEGWILDFIARTCFPGVVRINVLATLLNHPATVRHHVLPALREKQTRFWRLDPLLTRYFGLVASGGIFEGRPATISG